MKDATKDSERINGTRVPIYTIWSRAKANAPWLIARPNADRELLAGLDLPGNAGEVKSFEDTSEQLAYFEKGIDPNNNKEYKT